MVSVASYGWEGAARSAVDIIGDSVLKALREAGAGPLVLDAGCGNGDLARVLSGMGYTVFGVDADPAGVQIAREKVPDGNFQVASFFEDPPISNMDCVVSTEVIEHLYFPRSLIDYSFKALKPGGVLVISTPYHGYLKNLALALAGKWDHHHHPLRDGGHVKFFSRITLEALLSRAGFQVVRFAGAGRMPFLWKSMIVSAIKRSDNH
jgi:2-polyprenyl-3-methyl-5-hydroxy-6-metoxy-1,4-benzoquinol methylase